MARSTYVYLVIHAGPDGVYPKATFTVKRELIGWLGRQTESARSYFHVYRMYDGGGSKVTEITDDVFAA